MTNGNEPAYPALKYDRCGNMVGQVDGLTKREYFAAMAMQGFCSKPLNQTATKGEEADKSVAYASVRMADALLAELAKEPS